jgi:N-carbamoylputrescine amidase
MIVSLIQQTVSDSYQENLEKTVNAIQEAAKNGAKLVLLQELHTRFYFCQYQDPAYFEWAESIPGPTTQQLSKIAKQEKIVIVSSVFEKRDSGIFHNTAVVIDQDGEIKGIYRKMHIPDDPGFMEKFYFTPGDLGFKPIETSIGSLGVLVCWDQWFPEAARLMALAGAKILLYPTAIGWDLNDDLNEQQRQRDAWITIQRGHAIANQVFLLSCNRVGFEVNPQNKNSGIQFWGSSFIAGPQGEILQQADSEKNCILYSEINLARIDAIRNVWPYFRDRRIDCYQDLTKRYLK